ncbi:MAG: hypothetical protein JNK05_05810 [Myxococcales bacterium]|nr:hypothetical protein [Myxococcales bacterium]
MPLFKRHDGTLVSEVSLTRAIMPFIMRTRNESAVYFEQKLDVTRAHEYIAKRAAEDGTKLTFFHVYSYAVVQTLGERPRLNRFTSGGNLYQRKEIELGFSAKKQMDERSPVVVVKRAFDANDSFDEHVQRVLDAVGEARSPKPNQTDKELSIFLSLPRFVLRWGVSLLRWLDSVNLAPAALIGPDPLYTSVFIANLGSVGLDAAFHHMYEWGNCPIFAVVGRVHDEVQPDGSTRKFVMVRYTFDERIEDGLYCARALDRLRKRVERWGEPVDEAP